MQTDLYNFHTAAINRVPDAQLFNSRRTNVGSTWAMPDVEHDQSPLCMSWNEGSCVAPRVSCSFAMHATSVAAENPTAESTIGPSNVGTGEILPNTLANSQPQDQNTNNDVNNLLSLIPSSFFTLNPVKVNSPPPRGSLWLIPPINVDNLEMQLLVHWTDLKYNMLFLVFARDSVLVSTLIL